jgi:hypothetical protein
VPFSATSAVNFSDTGIQLFLVLFLMLILSEIRFKIKLHTSLIPSLKYALAFLSIALASLVMPHIIAGKVEVKVDFFSYEPLTPTFRHITQYLYLLIGFTFSFYLGVTLKNIGELKKVIRVYSVSIFFVILWGLLELCSFYLNFEYPSFIFNNNPNEAAQGFLKVLNTSDGLTLKRISSVTVEPSIFNQTILILVPLYIISLKEGAYIFNRLIDVMILVLSSVAILISTSTTGLITLLFIFFIFQITKTSTKVKLLSFFFLLLLFGIFAQSSLFESIINKVIIEKGESGSALDRIGSILSGWELFIKYPIIGIGWGSATIHDLIVKILCYSGLLGFSTFVLFFVKLFSDKGEKVHNFHTGLRFALATYLFMSIISGFAYNFYHGWFIIGLLLSSIKLKSNVQ